MCCWFKKQNKKPPTFKCWANTVNEIRESQPVSAAELSVKLHRMSVWHHAHHTSCERLFITLCTEGWASIFAKPLNYANMNRYIKGKG